jgi:sarcosine oxidase, subunit beta
MRKAEIVIIGGGVVGASVAFHLAERGVKDVLILEAEPVQGRGSTGAATGGIRAQFETDINILMSLYSLDFLMNWEFDCEYDPKGYLFFATTDEQFEYLKQNVARQKTHGVKDVETVDVRAIAEIVPGMNCNDIVGGCFGRQDGFINPLALMRGFTRAAQDRGVAIEFGKRVTDIAVESDRIRFVQVDSEKVECESVVLCNGAIAKELASSAGVDLPVDPQRRQIVWARTRESLPAELPMVIDIGSGFHFRPARDFNSANGAAANDIMFAYPDKDEPSSCNTSFDDGFIGKVYEHAEHRAGFLFESSVVREKCRAGLYENTPDHHAIIGGCGVEGLYFANGFSGHGVMHSPATGRALAEIILDGKASFLDVSCLSIERFAKGELLRETAFI